MTDWNGNGKLDPVDIGIDIARNASDEEKKTKPDASHIQNSGCVTVLAVFFMLSLCVILAYSWSFQHITNQEKTCCETGNFLLTKKLFCDMITW